MSGKKKPLLRRWWVWVVAFVVAVAIGGVLGESKSSNEASGEDTKSDVKVEIDEELSFTEYDVDFGELKVYKENGSLLADVKFNWTNRRLPDKTSLFVASMLEVSQSKQELEEINDAWNVENKTRSDVFFPNAAGGRTSVRLTYELIDDETPIEFTFTPTNEEEESQSLTVNIN